MKSILEFTHFELVLLKTAMEKYLDFVKESEFNEQSFITKDFYTESVEQLIKEIKLKINEQKS
jgi:diacylglycerol kinase